MITSENLPIVMSAGVVGFLGVAFVVIMIMIILYEEDIEKMLKWQKEHGDDDE